MLIDLIIPRKKVDNNYNHVMKDNRNLNNKIKLMLLFKYTIALILILFIYKNISFAYPSFPSAVDASAKNLYGPTAGYTFSCAGCHGSAGGTSLATGFGVDFKSAAVALSNFTAIYSLSNSDVQTILKNIELKDSDVDSFSNKDEFVAITNPGDPNSKPVVNLCVRKNPSLVATSSTLSTQVGGSVSFKLNLTNNDSSTCASSTFELTSDVGSSLNGKLSMNSIILAPGSAQSFSLDVSTLTTTMAGSYKLLISAMNSSSPTSVAQSTLNLDVTSPPAPVCSPKTPSLTLNPLSQNAVPGDTKLFTLSLTNLDSVECASTNFNIAGSAPSDLSLSLPMTSVILKPGEVKLLDISVLALLSISSSQTLSFTIKVSSTSSLLHSTSTSGKMVVSVVNLDTNAPTEPLNITYLPSKTRAKITWSPSTDESGSVIYNVLIDGVVVAETNRTIVRMKRPSSSASTLIIRAIDSSGNYTDSEPINLSGL